MSVQTRKKWFHGLGSAVITGFATSLLAGLSLEGAQATGVNVASLAPGQLLSVALAGGVVGMAAYLKQSPLPPMDEDK